MKRIKKLTSALLAMIIALSAFSAVSVSVSAAEIDKNIFVGSDFPDDGNSDYENDCIIFGDYEYRLLDDGTAEIVQYHGEDTQVAIPSEMDGYTVSSIGDYAFAGCYSLEKLRIPSSIKNIGEQIFSFCVNLTAINVDLNNKNYASSDGILFSKKHDTLICYPPAREDTDYTIPSGVTKIADGAFWLCFSLKSIWISGSVTSIGDSFSGCISLKRFDVSSGNSCYTSSDGILFSKNLDTLVCFPAGRPDTSYKIPDSVKKIAVDAFFYCYNLESITIPNSVIDIDDGAFGACFSLTSITIPNSVNKIGIHAFNECYNLKKVVIPNSVESIGHCAFYNCYSLESVVIPGNVEYIGEMAFGYYYDGEYDEDLLIDGFTIYGVKGSAAEQYANDNGIKFSQNLSAPQINKLENTTKGIKLTWDKVSGAYGYRVYRKNSNGEWKKIGSDTTSTSFTDSSVKPNKSETYTIRCVDKSGNLISSYNKSGWSFTYKAAAPTISLKNTDKGIQISWNKIAGVETYRVYYKNSSGKWTALKNVKGTSMTDTDVKIDKSKTYTIRCLDENGNLVSGYNKSGWSITYKPVAPTISVKNTAKGIQLSWNKVAGIDTYRVYYKNSSGKWVALKNVKGTSMTDTDVQIDKTKTYTIRCVDKNGNLVSGYNKNGWSITYKPVAPTLSLKNAFLGIQISWNKIAGVDTYRVYYKNSSGKWVALKNVKGTSMIDTDVRFGRTKTYTVRCLDKNGKPVGDYNRNGLSITYGN